MDPASIAAMAGTLASGASAVHSGLQLAHHLGSKYVPIAKSAANSIFSRKSRQSAKDYLSSLKTLPGLKKAITKDIPSAAKSASKFITSGRLTKGAAELASDVGKVTSLVDTHAGKNKYTSAVNQAVQKGLSGVQSVNDMHNQFISDYAKHANKTAHAIRN